jgi:peptidoglycan/xylan/chitin deacetylase (PgdA/CDA1 family)
MGSNWLKYFCRIMVGILILQTMHCKKHENRNLLGPGILLTVDKPPDTWFHLKDFLKENGIKLTFYIEGYHDLADSTKWIMKQLQLDGHEMAHHTNSHPHSDEYVENYGMERFLNEEIISVTDSMKKDGFNPLTFAYPFGDCTAETDNRLLGHFNSLRKVLGTYLIKKIADMDLLYFRYGDIQLFYGTGIDVRYHHPNEEVFDALEKAKNSKQTISLYCHFLSNTGPLEGSNSHIMEDDFKRIVLKAKELGLRFYTASEVSRKKFE